MASKSKSRRRVFRASCILAALIVAGSSFAWFTSKDEVTNRLSASADYGVSIVESFSPTNKWLPGQQVNKDVYATNTGNTEALVKEEIDTRIAITYEVDQAKWDEDCVQLTEEERYGIEAGSFLAYKPSDSALKTGDTVVVRPKDQTVPETDEFEPDTKGLYVFRRAIDVDANDQSETFTYDAYYFVPAVAAQAAQGTEGEEGYVPAVAAQPAKYYKVSNLQVYQDSHVAESTTTGEGAEATTTWTFKDYMGDGVYDDGTLMVASGSFRKEITDYVDPMDLTYLYLSETAVTTEPVANNPANTDEYYGMDKGQYLVATYDRGNNTAMADATAKAEAYDKAIHEYEYAQALFNQALKEYNQAKYGSDEVPAGAATGGSDKAAADLAQAKEDLEEAKTAYENAEKAYNNALTAYNNKLAKLDAAKKIYENSMKKLYGNAAGGTGALTAAEGGAAGNYTADSLYGKYAAAKAARVADGIPDTYLYTDGTDINAEFDAYRTAVNTGKTDEDDDWLADTSYTTLDTDELKAFRDWVDANTTGEKHNHFMLVIDEIIAETNYNNEKDKCLGRDVAANPDAEPPVEAETYTNYNDAKTGTYGAAYKTALTEYLAAYNALGDKSKNTDFDSYKDGTVIKNSDKLTENKTAKKDLDDAYVALNGNGLASDAEGFVNGAVNDYNDALDVYTAALEATEEAEELKDVAEALKEAATQVKAAAKEKYEAVDDAASLSKSDGKVKIYIKLNDDAVITDQTGNTSNEKWFLDPVDLNGTIGTDDIVTGTLLNNKAVFYYTGLLEGGETSSKLVDYVYLDDDIKANDYKNFDFDINVALKSAQVNFDEDGNYKTDAAQAEIGKFATYNGGTATDDANQVVTWSDSLT